MGELYKKTVYTDTNRDVVIGDSIVEYDIRSAGFNIIKHFKFIPEEKIEELSQMAKHDRHIAIGKLMKNDKELMKNMKKGFMACRKIFFATNDISDERVLSIRKDAIFLIGMKPKHTVFDNIEFIEKNTYDSYFYLNGKEFYMNRELCDVKGIKDEMAARHRAHMLDAFRELTTLMQMADISRQVRFMKEFAVAYRRRELDIGYYRELNQTSLYRPIEKIEVLGQSMGYNDCNLPLEMIDIRYNYLNYIVPLYKLITG